MPDGVGGVDCTFVRGVLAGDATELQLWRVPGTDGWGVLLAGKAGGPGGLILVKYDSATNVRTWFAAIEALQAGAVVVTITKDGADYANCLIERVSARQERAVIAHDGSTCRGELRVTVRKIG